jgi:outer membrane protein OmpA-like peptidoglycan-associated protein
MLRVLGIIFSILWAILLATTWRNFSPTDCETNSVKFPPKNDLISITASPPDSIFTVVDSSKIESPIVKEEKSIVKEEKPALINDGVNNKDFKKLLGTPVEVYFKNNSSYFIESEEYKNFLILAKAYISENPKEKLRIVGHTDSEGSTKQNKRFSLSRAIRMRDNLIKEGFKQSNLQIEAKGESEPLVDNTTEQNKALNRRVSIVLNK